MSKPLRVPCTYQGGKQRVAKQLVDILLEAASDPNTHFYDLCCGSGAVSIELVNRGVDPSRIIMLDLSSWGTFWTAVGSGSFDMEVFDGLMANLPDNKREVKNHMLALSKKHVGCHEAELYPVLQACSFGGKQIWHDGERWQNAFFRDYWEPTPTSVRRSPANPMQPSPSELRRRVSVLVDNMRGVTGVRADVMTILQEPLPQNAVVYVDPPYNGTTAYGFGFNVSAFAAQFRELNSVPLFISEGAPISDQATRLTFGGANGGITGVRAAKHQEWLSRF